MKKLLGLLAAAGLTLILLSPAAEARCGAQGHHWQCGHAWHHRHHHGRSWARAYYYPRASYYPYAYYPAAYAPAYYPVCMPFWPFCW